MKLNRSLRLGIALLFALVLPLQGYAAMTSCARFDHAVQIPVHSMAHHCAHSAPATHHPGCGDCCCTVGIVPTPGDWSAPGAAVPEIAAAWIGSPPTVALERLDRPPRPFAS